MRSNVYGQLRGESGYRTLGGRQNNDGITAWLNTDNASKSDCGITVTAEVNGEKQLNGKPRKTCHNCGRKWGEGHYDEENRRWVSHPDEDLRKCPECGATRQGIDTRRSCFEVRLPDQTDEHCEVVITTPHEQVQRILEIGAMLVTLQGAMQQVEGVEKKQPQLVKQGKLRIKQAMQLLAEHEEQQTDFPHVVLPGGVTLKHALACVALVNKLVNGEAHSES